MREGRVETGSVVSGDSVCSSGGCQRHRLSSNLASTHQQSSCFGAHFAWFCAPLPHFMACLSVSRCLFVCPVLCRSVCWSTSLPVPLCLCLPMSRDTSLCTRHYSTLHVKPRLITSHLFTSLHITTLLASRHVLHLDVMLRLLSQQEWISTW